MGSTALDEPKIIHYYIYTTCAHRQLQSLSLCFLLVQFSRTSANGLKSSQNKKGGDRDLSPLLYMCRVKGLLNDSLAAISNRVGWSLFFDLHRAQSY